MAIKDIITSVRNWFGYGWGSYPLAFPDYKLFAGGVEIPFVLPTNALQYTPVYRATTLIANDLARTPAEFQSYNLEQIWKRPNKFQSGYDFRRSLTLQACLFGNAFALINRKKNGEIYEILPLAIGSVSLDIGGSTPMYKTTQYGDIKPENILHIKASLLEGLWSPSPSNLCKTAITIGLAQEDQYFQGMKNGGDPKLAFIHPANINSAARQAIIADYMKNHRGSANAGKPLVLAEGMRVEKISSTANGSEIDVARKYSVQEVSRIYGVPLSYLSETAGSVYGSMEFLSRMYLDSCLSHWYNSWAAEFELKLGEAPYFDTDMLLRPTLTETFSALRTGVESGILTKNEARGYLDFEPVEGGDEFFMAKNMGTGGGESNAGIDVSKQNGETSQDNKG